MTVLTVLRVSNIKYDSGAAGTAADAAEVAGVAGVFDILTPSSSSPSSCSLLNPKRQRSRLANEGERMSSRRLCCGKKCANEVDISFNLTSRQESVKFRNDRDGHVGEGCRPTTKVVSGCEKDFCASTMNDARTRRFRMLRNSLFGIEWT